MLQSRSTMYGYASTRAKGMRSYLLSKQQMQSIISSKDINSLLSILNQTTYSKSLSKFGGVEVKASLIDYALSDDMAQHMIAVMRLTPNQDKSTMRSIVGRWDLHNIKIALEAKASKRSFDDISSFIIDYGQYNKLKIKEVMNEDSIEHMLQRFIINSNYSDILSQALERYSSTKSVSETINTINALYYKNISKSMSQLSSKGERAARVIRLEIDMRNITTLIKGRALSLDFSNITHILISNGNINQVELKKIYTTSDSIESLISKITLFDLKPALESYKKNKRLLVFEISMRSKIFALAINAITQSVLSLTTVIAYVYLKEIELSVLRAVITGKEYGLDKDELSGLMIWKAE
ncbi:MAG: V-type ATPase subunit [Candidatus Micrarchaeia archaeon]